MSSYAKDTEKIIWNASFEIKLLTKQSWHYKYWKLPMKSWKYMAANFCWAKKEKTKILVVLQD